MFKHHDIAPAFPNPKTYIVQASDLCSLEVYQYADGSQEPVLKNVSLEISRGECWGILGEEPFELELLMEIIGCVRPYGSGRVVLVERGMMRKKRKILPHVFYISDSDTVFPNMNTLEYLMFATAHQPTPAWQRQAAILQLLLDTGLYFLTLVPVKYLTRAQKAVVSLMAASFSKALLVIFAVSQLEFDARLCEGMRGIVEAFIKRGGAIVMATKDSDMVQAACTHAVFLQNGSIHYRNHALQPGQACFHAGKQPAARTIRCAEKDLPGADVTGVPFRDSCLRLPAGAHYPARDASGDFENGGAGGVHILLQ